MAWSKVAFEAQSAGAEVFGAAMLQLLFRLPSRVADQAAVYMRGTIEGGTEFIMSPLATKAAIRQLPEYPLTLCGRPPTGLRALLDGPFVEEPAYYDLSDDERAARLDAVNAEYADLLMDLGFIEDDRVEG